MKISILTLFPEMFRGPFDYSILQRAKEKKLLEIEYVNIRDFGIGKHKMVDDTPYGGGTGMVLRVDVIDKAVQEIRCQQHCKERVILMDARGETFTQQKAQALVTYDHLILIAGHYEGFDERVIEQVADEMLSIGDYVLTGGELPAMVITDTIARLIPGVIKAEATAIESFADAEKPQLEYPQYTKPPIYNGASVPDVLLSGNHKKIINWRSEQSQFYTKKHRPDLTE